MTDPKSIQAFIDSRPTAARSFWQKLRNAFKKLRKIINGTSFAERKILKRMSTAERLWADAFQAASERANGVQQTISKRVKTKARKPETTKSLTEKSRKNMRYSAKKKAANAGRLSAQAEITKQFQADVDRILSGTYKGKGALLLGYTPEIMEKLGIPSLPVVIGEGHVYSIAKTKAQAYKEKTRYKMANYHGLGETVVKNLYQYLNDPVMVIASKDVGNQFPVRSMRSVVAIIDIGQNNQNMLMPVEITVERNVNGKRIDVNVLSSAYLKNTNSLIENALAEENAGQIGIFYLDTKNETTSKIAKRVQFPIQPTKDVASGIILHQVSEKVNLRVQNQTQTKQFMRWFGDWQNSPSDASRIVNSDGTPKAMYHGTASDFWEFSMRRSNDLTGRRLGLGAGGNKIYLTEYEMFAKMAADGANSRKSGGNPHVLGVYVSAKKVMDRAQYNELLEKEYAKYPNSVPFSDGYDYKQRDKAIRAVDNRIKKEGYDGVWDRDSGELFVYSSNQIKSATDNIGTFDRSSNDIRYSVKSRSARS